MSGNISWKEKNIDGKSYYSAKLNNYRIGIYPQQEYYVGEFYNLMGELVVRKELAYIDNLDRAKDEAYRFVMDYSCRFSMSKIAGYYVSIETAMQSSSWQFYIKVYDAKKVLHYDGSKEVYRFGSLRSAKQDVKRVVARLQLGYPC